MSHVLKAALAAFVILATPLFASEFTPVDLGPLKHRAATLTIIAPDGSEVSYTPAELEQFPTYQLTTTTPWRDAPAVFEGVMLADVLAAHGLDTVAAIKVTAENDYSTTIEQALFSSVDILVATRVDGRPHSRRVRGPIQFVIDAETFANSSLTSESNLVWMAARIEVES